MSWASWLLFGGVHALRVVLCVRCPGPPGSCSPVCTLCVWCRAYSVLGLLAPVHRCARSVCGVACTVSWASWLLLTGVHALCASPVSWASRLLFTGVHALCVVVHARRPGPPGSRSPVCTLCVWWCVCGVLGLLARVHRCARSVCGVVCTVSWASWLLFTGVHALCVVLRLPFGPFALVRSCGACCVVRVVSWDTWFVFSGVAVCCGVCGVRCAVLRVWCPGPPGPCSPVRMLGVLRGVCGVGVGACSRVPYRGRVVADSLFLLKHFSFHIASYGVLLILPVLDSLIFATPKSKRVLMHAWRCMLFTRWFVDSLHFAMPKSRRVCLMHSCYATYSLCLGLFDFGDAQE